MNCSHEEDLLRNQEFTTQKQTGCSSSTRPRKARQPDSAYAYFVSFCGVLCNLIVFGCSYSFGLLFPLLLDEFKEGKAKTAWVGSLAYGSSGIFGPFIGFLYDRFDPRIVAATGSFLSTTALLLTSQAPNLTSMFFSYGILYGFGSACVYFTCTLTLQRYFIRRRSLVTGLAVMGPGGGLIIMSPIIQLLLNNMSWRMTFMSMGGIVFLTCVLSCSFDPNVQSIDSQSSEWQETQQRRRPRFNTFAFAHLEFSYLKNKEYLLYLVASSMVFSGIVIPIVHLARYCEDLGIDANHVAGMFSFNGLASAIFRALTGYLCDVNKQYPVWIFPFTALASGITALLMTVWKTYQHLMALFIFYGIMDGALASSMNILVLSILSSKEKSQGFGFFHLCIAITLAVGPAFGGFLADEFGSYNPAFYTAGSVQILAAGVLFLTHCFKHVKNVSEETVSHSSIEIVERITVL